MMHRLGSFQTGTGSLELVVIGLLAALVMVLAIPLFDTTVREPLPQPPAVSALPDE